MWKINEVQDSQYSSVACDYRVFKSVVSAGAHIFAVAFYNINPVILYAVYDSDMVRAVVTVPVKKNYHARIRNGVSVIPTVYTFKPADKFRT